MRHLVSSVIQSLAEDAQGVPEGERLAPRRTKPGSVDLTAATIFVGHVEKHARIVQHAKTLDRLVPWGSGEINLGVAIDLFLRALHAAHTIWRQKTMLTQSDLEKLGFDWHFLVVAFFLLAFILSFPFERMALLVKSCTCLSDLWRIRSKPGTSTTAL